MAELAQVFLRILQAVQGRLLGVQHSRNHWGRTAKAQGFNNSRLPLVLSGRCQNNGIQGNAHGWASLCRAGSGNY